MTSLAFSLMANYAGNFVEPELDPFLTPTSGAWNFFTTPTALLSPTGSWNGIPSNCTTCSVAEMFTIATNNINDGSCYGYCSDAGPDGRWDEVVGGELVPSCTQVHNQSAMCTIEYESDGNGGATWAAGENDSGAGVGFSFPDQQDAIEGINLNLAGFQNSSSSPRENSSSRRLSLLRHPARLMPTPTARSR